MDPKIEKRLKAMSAMATSGQLGEKAQLAARAYADAPEGVTRFIMAVQDLYTDLASQSSDELAKAVDHFVQVMIVVYREAKKADPTIAGTLPNALIMDFPGSPGTCLLPKWDTLIKASIGFSATRIQDPVVAWQQMKTLVEAANEFLNGLLGFLLANWRCSLGKPVKPGLFKQAYGAKVNELAKLTDGEEGIFRPFLLLAQYHLRNAIAHGDAWVNADEQKIEYSDAGNDYEMSLPEFGFHALVGSWLSRAYLGAVAAIGVLEAGNLFEVMQLPPHLVKLYHHKPEITSEGPPV